MAKEKEEKIVEATEPIVAEPVAVKAPVEETVTLPKKTLEDLLDRVDRIEFAASKSRLAHYDKKNPDAIGKEVSVSVYEEKIVTAWETIEDIVEKNPTTGVWMERQTIRLHFLEGEAEEMAYQQFVRRTSKKAARVLSETKLEDGRTTFKIETIETGLTPEKVLEIDIAFIN